MVWRWSKTSATNATADSSINWAEGQAPSSINDSARATMARVAQYRDDIAGAIITGGTSTAYTVTSNQVFDTLAHLDGAMIAFTPHATNTAGAGTSTTLSVDSLGARPIRMSPSVDLPSGTLVSGTPYVVVFNNSDSSFYLQGGFNPYGVPLASGLDFWGVTAPNSAFAFPYGQAISRTTYSSLYTLIGTSFGSGDGSTTFNLPDTRGYVRIASDSMGGVNAGRVSINYNQTAGAATATLAVTNLPNTTFGGSPVGVSASGTTSTESQGHEHGFSGTTDSMNRSNPHSHTYNQAGVTFSAASFPTGNPGGISQTATATNTADINHEHTFSGATAGENATHTHNVTVTGNTASLSVSSGGSGTAFSLLQPTIGCFYIMRIF